MKEEKFVWEVHVKKSGIAIDYWIALVKLRKRVTGLHLIGGAISFGVKVSRAGKFPFREVRSPPG